MLIKGDEILAQKNREVIPRLITSGQS